MSTAEKLKYTLSDYFDLEETSQEKYEYHDGYIIAMSGGTRRHSRIASSINTKLTNSLLGKGCEVFTSDLKVSVLRRNNYYYPDCTVVCGDLEVDDSLIESNPTIIVEVLSKSTESFDRGEKFEAYRTIESLQEYVLISQHKPLIEVFTKNEYGFWLLRDAKGMDASIKLNSVEVEISLAEIYRNVVFDEIENF